MDIGNLGVAAESNTVRIGTQGTQKATYIAGIFGSSVTGDAVVVSNTGKLGIVMSSARYKRDIHDMDAASSNLMKLRPVTFRYKDDPRGRCSTGWSPRKSRALPGTGELCTDGKVKTVRYLTLTAMLLNELQKQAREKLRNRQFSTRKQLDGRSLQAEPIKGDPVKWLRRGSNG